MNYANKANSRNIFKFYKVIFAFNIHPIYKIKKIILANL